MFFKIVKKANILIIKDDFATLSKINDHDDVCFKFCYETKQSIAIKLKATTVRVSILLDQNSSIDKIIDKNKQDENLIEKILLQFQKQKDIDKSEKIISFKNSDISSKINNKTISLLSGDVDNSEKKSVIDLQPVEKFSEIQPILQFIAFPNISPQTQISSSLSFKTQDMMQDLIFNHGIDPSSIVNLTHRSISAEMNFQGTLRTKKNEEKEYEPLTQILNKYIFSYQANPGKTNSDDLINSNFIQTVVQKSTDQIKLFVDLTIPSFHRQIIGTKIENTNFFVKFELINNQKNVIDTVIKNLDILSHINFYNVPKKPPKVKLYSNINNPFATIEIELPPKAIGYEIYKKLLSRSEVVNEDYELIGKFISKNKNIITKVNKAHLSPIVYRIIPFGKDSIQSFEFTNVISLPSISKGKKSISLTTKNNEKGLEIEIRNFPYGAVSIQVLRKNLSNNEKVYSTVGNQIFLSDDLKITNFHSQIDNLVNEFNIYEYRAKIIFKNGLFELSDKETVEYQQFNSGKIDLKISDLIIDNDFDNPNVTFKISSKLASSNIQTIKNILSSSNNSEFDLEISNQRDKLDPIIAYNIQRLNVTKGKLENFGTFTDSFFDDQKFRKIASVENMVYGEIYRYKISALVRDPETLFSSYIKTSIDTFTGKSYTWSPSKYKHPLTLRDGTLYSENGIKVLTAKDELSHGSIGTSVYVDVAFDTSQINITDVFAEKFDNSSVEIKWKIDGNIKFLDHMIILKDVHGVRTVIGKVHSEFNRGNSHYINFIHSFSIHDKSQHKYVIIPVQNDYKLGNEAFSNEIIL